MGLNDYVITHYHSIYNLALQKWTFKGTVYPKTDLYDFLNWNVKDVSLNVNTNLLRTMKNIVLRGFQAP